MPGKKLRILFVSGFMPPHAPVGAVRNAKLESYWRQAGHDVRTIAVALPAGGDATPPHPDLYYLPHQEPGRWITQLKAALTALPKKKSSGTAPGRQAAQAGTPGKPDLKDLYRQILTFPDRYRAWSRAAIALARSWEGSWKPDLIYSSGPPHSGQVVAARLATRWTVPWICEMRDLWIGDPYSDRHPLVTPFLHRFARRILAKASGFVVVTEGSRQRLRTMTSRPVVLSYNGYDPADFAGMDNVAPLDAAHLTIIHAGTIYPGRRDPSALFRAIAGLGEQRHKIRCLFYSDTTGSVAALAQQAGIADSVEIRDAMARTQILRVERQADILLECRWIDPAGDGVIPGKLFEYIGARRPILSLGPLTGEAAAIVRDNGLGLASNDPDEIKAMLLKALETKAALGRLPDRPAHLDDAFRRDTQFHKIDGLLGELLAQPDALG